MDHLTREQFDREVERVQGEDAEARRYRSWAAVANEVLHAGSGRPGAPVHRCPELSPELLWVEAMHGRLGTDANGRSTGVEMRELWEREDIDDPGMREALEILWRAIEAESARYLWEQRKAMALETERARNN
jgi:hypothetical protein